MGHGSKEKGEANHRQRDEEEKRATKRGNGLRKRQAVTVPRVLM